MSFYEDAARYYQTMQEQRYRTMSIMEWLSPSWRSTSTLSPETQAKPEEKLKQLKKSVKQIEAEPFTGEVRKRIENKIERLEKVGAINQALILVQELQTRDMLVRLKDWDYKLLTKECIDKFSESNRMTLTTDGLKIHIDSIENYVGNPDSGKEKDRIIPDEALREIEKAKERQLFTSLSVLWVEKVPDPIVLGCIEGCEDYFYICEWGDDITFEQLTNGIS